MALSARWKTGVSAQGCSRCRVGRPRPWSCRGRGCRVGRPRPRTCKGHGPTKHLSTGPQNMCGQHILTQLTRQPPPCCELHACFAHPACLQPPSQPKCCGPTPRQQHAGGGGLGPRAAQRSPGRWWAGAQGGRAHSRRSCQSCWSPTAPPPLRSCRRAPAGAPRRGARVGPACRVGCIARRVRVLGAGMRDGGWGGAEWPPMPLMPA